MNHPSRELFGRDRELSEADTALDAAASGTPQVLLVGGDAGIGKTTLVKTVTDEAGDRGFRVLVGHCLDIDDGVGLRPVHEALRLAGAVREGATVDELGQLVGRLVTDHPVLLVLEDMHWADRSTIDFATAIARTTRGPLCLVLTYRTDEIGTRHPFRQALVDIGRSEGARRVDLSALGRDDIAGLVLARTGTQDRALARALHERSEGNPLYAEELIAAGADRLPEQLSDLLLARIDALSESTRGVLRLASAHGSRLWPELLGEADGLDTTTLDHALREAVDANVLRRAGEHLEFRHGLLREAVYDDLMPGERGHAHRVLARALERLAGDQPGLRELGLLSFHWYAAHDVPAAFDASLRAGQMAWDQAWLDTATFLERALELYDQVPNPGIHKADLLRMLASGVEWTFDRERSRRLIAEALDLVEGTDDPFLSARIYTSYAVRSLEVEGGPTHEEALERAIEGLHGQPSEELVKAYSTLAGIHMRRERMVAADEALRQALELAASLDVPREEADTWRARGWCALWLGDLHAAAAYFTTGQKICRRIGMGGGELLCELGVVMVEIAGLDPTGGILRAQEVQRRARDGAPDLEAMAALERATGLLHLGRFSEADRALGDALASGGIPADDYLFLVPQARMHLLRGEGAAALSLERVRMARFSPVASVPNYEWTLMHIQVLLANGLVQEALERSREWLDLFAESDGVVGRGPVVHGAYLAVEAGRRAGLDEAETLLEQADRFLAKYDGALGVEARRSFLGYSTPVAIALRAELHGQPSAHLWRAAHDAAAHIGPGLALPIRLRLVQALLAEGERDEARTALPELVAEAKTMGAMGVAHEALKVARRHRIPVSEDDRPSKLDILTSREREVLDALATGATNKAIAERLFISEKTVSVHVTNLLAKLGVTNRTEAATMARDLAVVE
jgi:DNA-binding CsgD family transcriptional regulator